MKDKFLSGAVLFYCAYDSKKDRKFDLNVNNQGMQLFDTKQVVPGRYTVKVNWNADGKNFYTEKIITVI